MDADSPKVRFASIDIVFLIQAITKDDKVLDIDGQLRIVLHDMINKLNTSYSINTILDPQIGKKAGDSWTGLIGSFYNNDSDISICPIPTTYENIQVLDFTIPVIPQRWSLLSGQPLLTETHFLATLTIFDEEIWLLIITTILTFPFAFTVAKFLTSAAKLGPKTLTKIYYNYLYYTTSVFLRQAFVVEPRPIAKRIAWLPWIVASYLLTSAFTGILLSKLTLPDIEKPVQKLGDLVGHPDISIFVLEDTPVELLIENPHNPIMAKILPQVRKFKNKGFDQSLLVEIIEGVDQVKQGKAVAIGLEDVILQGAASFLTDSEDIDTFYLSPYGVLDEIYAFAYRKGFDKELANKLNELMMAYSRSSLFMWTILKETFQARLWLLRDKSRSEDGKLKRLKLKSLYFAFGLWSFGILTSFVALFIEIALTSNLKVRKSRIYSKNRLEVEGRKPCFGQWNIRKRKVSLYGSSFCDTNQPKRLTTYETFYTRSYTIEF